MGLSVGDKTVSEFTVGNTPIKQGADEGNLFRGKNRKTFSYTGSEQSFTVPVDGYYILECWGASGGNDNRGNLGGRGGYAKGKVFLTAGTVLKIYVGEKGKDNSGGLTDGAFNGGGKGGRSDYRSSNRGNGGGGGASDVRIGGDTLYHRLIVGGGGGGASPNNGANGRTVMCGGGEEGNSPRSGAQGTQTDGYSFGIGFSSDSNNQGNRYCCNGGGGGWYGGGKGSSLGSSDTWNDNFYAGGGSGFVREGQDTVPSGYLVSEDYVLDEIENIKGNEEMPNTTGTGTMTGNVGNGCVVITCYVGSKGEKVTEAGIYHNPDLGLISMSADGENRVTISDKNAGARSDDIEDELSYGGYFQFGNIHGFGVLPEPVPPEPTPRREPGENTLLYMPLNGDVLDYSGNDNDGTITGTIEQRTIGIGDRKYAYFNNDSAIGLVSVPVGTGNVESHTFCCWAKVSPNGVCRPFFMGTDSNGQRYSLVLNYGTSSFQHIMDVYGSPDVPLSSSMGSKQYADQRVHIVYTYDKSTSTHTLYLNTVQSGSSNLRGLNIGSNNKYIGRSQSENGYGLSEIIFEQGIRTQQQIDDHFNLTKSAYGIN